MSWQIYDNLIATLPTDITVVDFGIAPHWAWLRTSDEHIGIAAVYPGDGRPVASRSPIGRSLRDVASLSKAWNFSEAGVGVAAINAWHNRPFSGMDDEPDAFEAHAHDCAGKRIGVIGHFPRLPQLFSEALELRIFERNPRPGDYPDSAAEFLISDLDVLFITGSALVNKTLPRLLELARGIPVILVGPSTPVHPALFDAGVTTLSSFIPTNPAGLLGTLKGIGGGRKWDFGKRVNVSVKC